MPLFKGQGCKSTPGKVIAYVTDNKKAEIISSQNLDDSRCYAQQFRDTCKLFEKGGKFQERKYYHFKLSCDRADAVTAIAHHEYAEAVTAQLFAKYECVIATHTDTDTTHSHIIVNAVSFEDGYKLHCNNREYGQMKDIANRLGIERGFAPLDFRQPAHKKITSKERIIELSGGTSWKEELREVIQLAKKDTRTITEFEKYLNGYGIVLTRNTEKTIAYKHPQKEKSIRGEKLGADYTKGALKDEFERARWPDTQRKIDAECGTRKDGNGDPIVKRGVGYVERELRTIIEGVHSLTADGRAEKAARERAEAERAAAAQRAASERIATIERAAAETARRIKRERNQIKERESKIRERDFGPSL